jgi:hypothetical protein
MKMGDLKFECQKDIFHGLAGAANVNENPKKAKLPVKMK